MRARWFGQSAFLLSGERHSVMIDPFGPGEALAERGLRFAYPAIDVPGADLILISHEHFDHNHTEAVPGSPPVVRSTAGSFHTPVGEVLAIASEHDQAAGTERGPNTIFVFELDGLRVCHMGDFGQARLRDEQRRLIGTPDVLFIPVGGGPTIGGARAIEVLDLLSPRIVAPMHYRTEATDFLDPLDPFLGLLGDRFVVRKVDASEFACEPSAGDGPVVLIPSPPLGG